MDYVSSGKLWPGTFYLCEHAIRTCGLELVDRFEMIGQPGPQSQKRQVHARRNHSSLFVFRKPSNLLGDIYNGVRKRHRSQPTRKERP